MALTPKQEKFAQGLFRKLSQAQAYREAYDAENMSNETIYNEASELAKNPEISMRVDQLNAEVAAMNMLSESYVIQNLMELQQRCMQKIPVMEWDKEAKEWVHTGEWKFDSAGANGALEKLGKYLKMFTEKVESKNVNVNQDITNMTAEERRKRIAELKEKLGE